MSDAALARRGGRRLTIALWFAIGALAVWTIVRLAGLDAWYPMAQLIAFTPYVAALAVLPLAAALLTRRWPAAAVAAVLVVALGACVLPRWLPDRDPLAGAGGPRLRVLSSNLLMGSGAAAALVALVREHRVDLLAVQELTPEAVDRLQAAGLAAELPHRVTYPEPGVTGSGIWARQPLTDAGLRVNPCGFGQARGSLAMPGAAELLVESVHPCAPSSSDTTEPWRQGLAGQPAATVDGPVRVLLGDFNATLDHDGMRRLLDTGYRDAADVVGGGLSGTWGPYDGDTIPPVTLDHVLADRRVGVRSTEVLTVPNSDHRAILAELVLP